MFHEVHAELLQVKKAQCEEEIDEKNKELQQLKLALEKIQVINFWKVSEDPGAPACPSCCSPWSHVSWPAALAAFPSSVRVLQWLCRDQRSATAPAATVLLLCSRKSCTMPWKHRQF